MPKYYPPIQLIKVTSSIPRRRTLSGLVWTSFLLFCHLSVGRVSLCYLSTVCRGQTDHRNFHWGRHRSADSTKVGPLSEIYADRCLKTRMSNWEINSMKKHCRLFLHDTYSTELPYCFLCRSYFTDHFLKVEVRGKRCLLRLSIHCKTDRVGFLEVDLDWQGLSL